MTEDDRNRIGVDDAPNAYVVEFVPAGGGDARELERAASAAAAMVVHDKHLHALGRDGERGALRLLVLGSVPRILREDPV